MVEENIAIICACLPMCRMPLAWLFPTVFGGTTTRATSSYRYNSTQRTDRPISGWQPYSGASKTEGFGQGSETRGDDTSEEFILNDMQPAPGVENSGRDVGAIRKTTQYTVSYEQETEPKVGV